MSNNSRNEDIYANANRYKPERPIGEETIAEEQSIEHTGETRYMNEVIDDENSIFHGNALYMS